MRVLLCLAFCLALADYNVEGLSCLGPGKKCTATSVFELGCRYGTTSGPCGNCVCAKGFREECGGPFGVNGACARFLTCNKDPSDFNASGKCVFRLRFPWGPGGRRGPGFATG